MALSPGTVVAGYTIEAVLGAGGMGTVYKARNPALPRSDALKVLSEGLSRDDHFRARFLREADLAATLDHPNIVTVYTRGETEDGQLWIAMQYVNGSDAEKETRARRMSPQRAVYIVGEVAKALDYAHRRQLLHRDVKPANFLLGSDDERVLLADFGIARALDDATNLTQTGMVVATIAYAAPESLSGYSVDGRADIYSLGCSLYNLLTGRTPFGDSGGMAATMAAHLNQPPPRATALVPALPPAVDRVLARAMAKNPNDRYPSAREFAAAAAQALDQSTVAVRTMPVTPLSPRPTWSGPSTGPGAHTYPSPQPTAPRFTGGQPPYPHERPSTIQPQPSARTGKFTGNRRRWGIGAGAAAVVAVVVVLVVAMSGGEGAESSATSPTSTTASSARTTTAAPSTPDPSSAPPAPANVDDAALPGLLLSANDVSGRMNKPGMTAMPTEYEPLAGSVTPPNCTGAWGPVYRATYDGSGFTGLVVQGVFADPTHKLVQAVTAFPDANAAKAFYDRQVVDWEGCKNTHIRFEYEGASTEADLGVPATTAGILTMKLNPTTSATTGQQCERNLAVRANVIVDVRACSPTVGSSGLSIASAIADKIK
ncbi:serine/threonine-protein kinase PknH/PknJ [Mycolicibacterium tusciae]|uniref:serine/threonine-protein kinase PknH/PknJ n=1 Tax=Mycolicibacterium tusciae TaxID=75922 RepID=UPI00024A4F38|nr:serine/threonine-protein kinase PknH/PknJ [Mycolicibacterium tusciae]